MVADSDLLDKPIGWRPVKSPPDWRKSEGMMFMVGCTDRGQPIYFFRNLLAEGWHRSPLFVDCVNKGLELLAKPTREESGFVKERILEGYGIMVYKNGDLIWFDKADDSDGGVMGNDVEKIEVCYGIKRPIARYSSEQISVTLTKSVKIFNEEELKKEVHATFAKCREYVNAQRSSTDKFGPC